MFLALKDLRPLEDMPLQVLDLSTLQALTDLSPLAGMPLRELNLSNSDALEDLAPIAHLNLESLDLTASGVSDVTPLKDMANLHAGNQAKAPRLCTLRMSRRLDPDRQLSHRLTDVAERYGVALVNPHDALCDAEATAAVLPHLLTAHKITTASQLEPFFDRDSGTASRS